MSSFYVFRCFSPVRKCWPTNVLLFTEILQLSYSNSVKATSGYDYLPGLNLQTRSLMNLYQKRGAAQDRLNSILAKYKSDPNRKSCYRNSKFISFLVETSKVAGSIGRFIRPNL